VVRNQDGLESAFYPFEVSPAPSPVLTGVSPSEARLGDVVTLQVYGIGFFGEPTVSLAAESEPDVVTFSPPLALVDSRRVVTEPLTLTPGLFAAQSYLLWLTNPHDAASNRVRFVVLE
jgi:hypothetical protein